MKDLNNTSLTIRTKVSSNLNSNSISSLTPLVRTAKFDNNNSTNTLTTTNNQHLHNNNSDDEFELPLGNLIIDLDADIEKSNERLSSENSESHLFTRTSTTNSNKNSTGTNNSINKLSNNNLFEQTNSKAMSTSKTIRDVNSGTNSTQQINQLTSSTQATNNLPNSSSSSSNSKSSTTTSSSSANLQSNLQSSTVDKSLKLKIKRKSIGGKSSESKLEVVQSDTNPRHNSSSNYKSTSIDKNGLNNLPNSTLTTNELEKVKHSSSKNKNGASHKERKEKKDKNSNSISSTKNTNNDSFANLTNNNNNDTKEAASQRNPVVLNFDKKILNQSFSNDRSFNQINQLKKDSSESPPFKKSKNDEINIQNSTLNNSTTKSKPEMRSVSTTTNASTMTEPECLGFCEPGSAICLEGITWIEAEGVLVVNVTWRGKSYVGTLLDCTRHDWGPPHPRLCDSPTSDLESKGLKSGRGKRARSSIISEQDSRLFQSKLRNGKGRRNFTVPASPLKVDQTNKRNRNGKDGVVDKLNNQQQSNSNRNTPTPTQLEQTNGSITSSPTTKQPISPVLIECPEPNCSKKYKHINGLKYHQTHSHSGTNLKSDDLDENCKDTNVITDTEDMETESIANSPSQVNQVNSKISENNNNSSNETDNKSSCDNNSENIDKRTKANCDKNSDSENVQSPAYSDISDANENGNELSDCSTNKINSSTTAASTVENHHKQDDKELKKIETNTEPIKENDLIKNETKPVKEEIDKSKNNEKELQDHLNKPSSSSSLITNSNDLGLDKNCLNAMNNNNNLNNNPNNNNLNNNINNLNNSNPPQHSLLNPGNPPMNPNFQFPFGMLPNAPYPLPIDPIHAYLMHQDRLLIDEQQKQQQAFQATLNSFAAKNDPTTMHLNELHNELQKHQQRQHQQFKTPPLSTSSPQTSSSSSIYSQSTSNQQSQNKPSSPYDFMHHEKQQREEMLKLSGNRAEERFSLSKNQSMGNLSSPKQPPSVQQLYNQQQNNNNLSMNKDEQRSTPKHLKQDEGIKPTGTTTGPPPAPTNSFFHPMSSFLAQPGPQQVFPNLPFDANSQLFRAQHAAASNTFNQNFMNSLRFPLSGHQFPTGLTSPNLNLPGNPDMNNMNNMNNALNANGNKKAFEMLQQQVSQQYNLKEMQDKMLISPTNKNGLPTPVSLSNQRQSSNQLGSLTNTILKEDNLSPQRMHPGIQSHPLQPTTVDPFGALINKHAASSFPK